jgi:hypothetical protein
MALGGMWRRRALTTMRGAKDLPEETEIQVTG